MNRLFDMKNGTKYHGAVVPMVTPVTTSGELDETAVDRLIGLASANKSLIGSMEEGKLAVRMKPELLLPLQQLLHPCIPILLPVT